MTKQTDQENDAQKQNLEVRSAEVVRAQAEAEIDVQIATAKRYPRSLSKARERVLAMATATAETAEECFYAIPRGGKVIEGPSVRLAEITAAAYGNIRAASRVIAIDEQFVTAQGIAHDLEANIAATTEVKRRITNSYGKRYGEDMIMVTANAACAVAFRNAVWKVIPRSLFADQWRRIREVAAGDEATMGQRLADLADWFAGHGLSARDICALVDRRALADIELSDLVTLREVATAIKEGTISASALRSETDGLGERLAQGRHEFAPSKGGSTPATEQGDGEPGRQTKDAGEPSPGAKARALAETLELGPRAERAFGFLGLETVSEVQAMLATDPETLLSVPGVGAGTVEKIETAVNAHLNADAADREVADAPNAESGEDGTSQGVEDALESEMPADSESEAKGGQILASLDKLLTVAPGAFNAACRAAGIDPDALESLEDIPVEIRSALRADIIASIEQGAKDVATE